MTVLDCSVRAARVRREGGGFPGNEVFGSASWTASSRAQFCVVWQATMSVLAASDDGSRPRGAGVSTHQPVVIAGEPRTIGPPSGSRRDEVMGRAGYVRSR